MKQCMACMRYGAPTSPKCGEQHPWFFIYLLLDLLNSGLLERPVRTPTALIHLQRPARKAPQTDAVIQSLLFHEGWVVLAGKDPLLPRGNLQRKYRPQLLHHLAFLGCIRFSLHLACLGIRFSGIISAHRGPRLPRLLLLLPCCQRCLFCLRCSCIGQCGGHGGAHAKHGFLGIDAHVGHLHRRYLFHIDFHIEAQLVNLLRCLTKATVKLIGHHRPKRLQVASAEEVVDHTVRVANRLEELFVVVLWVDGPQRFTDHPRQPPLDNRPNKRVKECPSPG
mmetsp:Transcript_2864/g.5108  ORF Transcript_2864/g.5108 Transcript_2864/m.5108 type:complete len:279 (-) Transcript_2864:681-1517(-)